MIKIHEITPFMKKGWVAMDKNGAWFWYSHKPVLGAIQWHCKGAKAGVIDDNIFNILSADDWTKSLVKVGKNEKNS